MRAREQSYILNRETRSIGPQKLSAFTPITIINGYPYQILGDKPVKNVQIDPQTTDIWPKELFVTLSAFLKLGTCQSEIH